MSRSRPVELIFGAFVSAIYLTSCAREHSPKHNAEYVKRGVFTNETFGGKLKFLTMLNLYAHTIYFVICTLNVLYEIIVGKSQQQSGLRRFCNFLYTTLIFPAGICVCVQFWGIYLINRDLIFPKILDELIPPWQNHVMHTLPLIAAVGDNLLTKHTYNKSFFWGVLPTLTYAICYLTWIIIIAIYGGFWVYPILNVLAPFHRALFFTFSIIILIGFYKLGDWLNGFIWSGGDKIKKHQKKN